MKTDTLLGLHGPDDSFTYTIEYLKDYISEFFKEVLYYWKSVSTSQFIPENFQGTLSKQDYLITNKKLTAEVLETLGINTVLDDDGNKIMLDGELFGSFRIISTEDGQSRALIEVTGKNVITPNGWVDGMLLDGTWIRNALLTNKEGNLLSISFFDPYNPTASKLKNDNWLEVEFLESLSDTDKDYQYYKD